MDVDIETVDSTGDGLARGGGMTIHVPYTIPGERVRVHVEHRRGREAWGSVEAILNASPHRIAPRCAHFGPPDHCGGCTWQHISYPEQLRLKSTLVRACVAAAMDGGVPEVRPTLPATRVEDPWGYRHKAHFVFANADRGRRLVMGHYSRGTRHVFDACECPVHDPRGNAFALRLHEQCAAAGIAAASDAGRGPGALRSIAMRVGANTPELMATLVVTDPGDKRLRSATRRALATPEAPQSFHLNIHPRPDPYIFGRDTRHIRGPHHLRERVADTTFLVSPTAFFQTNVHAAEILVGLVLDGLPPGQPVLDLYAGVGLFALPLAKRGDRVTAVEENRAATADGIASLRVNRVDEKTCRFVARRVEAALQSLQPRDAVHAVLDPPREGCAPAVLDELFGRIRPARAAYVSCNPEALGRDLARIARHGYRPGPLQPVDMFPHTAHVETVAILTR